MEHAVHKKSRAKSCTACRQVKLKCDARDTYPSPCSRCKNGKYECKMDASFKRVATRRRIEDLTNQLSNVQRALAFEQLADVPIRTAEPQPFTSRAISMSSTTPSDQTSTLLSIQQIPETSISADDSVMDALWFDRNSMATVQDHPTYWTLDRVMVEHHIIVDLFQQFNDFYFPHLPIFEPITSLKELYTTAPALFWGVTITASRYHPHHSDVYGRLIDSYQRLHEQTICRPVQVFAEVQALLLLCYWPLALLSQSEDPTWMHCGLVTNTALSMGLDKFNDEVLFGHRKSKHSLQHVNPRNRMMTWMKCFQVSCQLSAWEGLPPLGSSASSLHKLATLYDESSIPLETIALTEIQRQYARAASTFEETNNEPSLTLVQMFMHDLDNVKQRFSSGWSISCEINVLGVKLYILGISLVTIDRDRPSSLDGSDASAFFYTILQWAHAAAIRLTKRMVEAAGPKTSEALSCAPYGQGCPLLAHPKSHFRILYYACIILLKYLDCNRSASPADKEAARNAVSTTYQVFTGFRNSHEHVRAAASLEVLARALSPDKERMVTTVKTRMGASLRFNAIWTAAMLRGFYSDPKYSVDACPAAIQSSHAPTFTPNAPAMTLPMLAEHTPTAPPMQQPMLPATVDNESLPWGIWDDSVFDAWGIPWDDQAYADMAGTMDFF